MRRRAGMRRDRDGVVLGERRDDAALALVRVADDREARRVMRCPSRRRAADRRAARSRVSRSRARPRSLRAAPSGTGVTTIDAAGPTRRRSSARKSRSSSSGGSHAGVKTTNVCAPSAASCSSAARSLVKARLPPASATAVSVETETPARVVARGVCAQAAFPNQRVRAARDPRRRGCSEPDSRRWRRRARRPPSRSRARPCASSSALTAHPRATTQRWPRAGVPSRSRAAASRGSRPYVTIART